jgi:hypothetical protein
MANTICPNCGSKGRVPDTFLGRRVKCPKCQTPFTVGAEAEAEAPVPPARVKAKAPTPAPPPAPTRPARAARPTPPPPPAVEEDVLEEAAATAPVAFAGRIQYGRAYGYIRENPKWTSTVLMGALCSLIPVVGGIALSGYQYDIVEALAVRGEQGYPDFEFGRFGKYLMRGLWPFLVFLIVFLPLLIVVQVVNVVLALFLPQIVGYLFSVLGLILYFLVSLLLVPMCLRAGLGQRLDLGGNIKFAQDFLKRAGKEVLFVQLFLVLTAGLVVMVGMLLCCVGVYASLAVITLAGANLDAQLYQVYLARGGEPIPLKEEPLPAA